MATRGCTSGAASRDPQVFRVPWTVIVGTLAAAMHRLKLRLTLRGSIGVPCRVVTPDLSRSTPGRRGHGQRPAVSYGS